MAAMSAIMAMAHCVMRTYEKLKINRKLMAKISAKMAIGNG